MKFATFQRNAESTALRFQNMFERVTAMQPPITSVQFKKLEVYRADTSTLMDQYQSDLSHLQKLDKPPVDFNVEEFNKILLQIPELHADLTAQIDEYIQSAVQDITPPASIASSEKRVSSIKLPRISLPSFDGDQESWLLFQNLFDTTVNQNSELPSIEKFQLLLSCLKGEALATVRGIPISTDNYEIAWDSLNERYTNKRRLKSIHLTKLLDLPDISCGNVKSMRLFISTFKENKRALAQLDYAIDDKNYILVTSIFRKMDSALRKRFEQQYKDDEYPTLKDVETFLETECKNLESAFLMTKHTQQPTSSQAKPKYKVSLATTSGYKPQPCIFCGDQSHKIYTCSKFKNLVPAERKGWVENNKVQCVNCLSNSHSSEKCGSRRTCFKCRKRHHTFICTEQTVNKDHKDPVTAFSALAQGNQPRPHENVLLGTALAKIKTKDKGWISTRLVIDPCSQISAISRDFFRKLGIAEIPYETPVVGLSQAPVPNSQTYAPVSILPSAASSPQLNADLVILDTIAPPLPTIEMPASLAKTYSGYDLADPLFYQSRSVDILLGADVTPRIFKNGFISLKDKPCCFKTIFGWIIIGPASTQSSPHVAPAISMLTAATQRSDYLNDTLRKFWEIEELPTVKRVSPEDEACERYFQDTTYRDETGRYVVSLPFRESPSKLGSNRDTCVRRFKSFEYRMAKDPTLKLEYSSFFEEYLQLGHMARASSPSAYLIPHHAVIKTSSSTTKLRSVFDASCTDTQGVSLNSLLYSGPKLQPEITHTIQNFRTFKFIVCADIKMMYRQILLNPNHRKYQHILWRKDPSEPLLEYELATVTYGITPSSFLAQRVLRQLVTDEGHDFPLASKAIMEHCYVDNIATGHSSEEMAVQLKDELKGILSRAGFHLRKYYSNSAAVLKNIPEADLEKSTTLEMSTDPVFQMLGLHWRATDDTFLYLTKSFPETAQITKRSVLSFVAKTFDPMGWLAPTILWAKHFIQQLWLSGTDWDDPVPPQLEETWKTYTAQFHVLSTIRISRFIPYQESFSIRLVGFSDASSVGYGAATYAVLTDNRGNNSVHLIAAKGKVAPIKTLTIPRLELSGAYLLARLFQSMENHFSQLPISNVYFFSDSSVVLHWLKKPPHLLKVFVANRVTKILELTQPSSWHYISTTENPADFISRGCLPETLTNAKLWWDGPPFLKKGVDEWPLKALPNEENLPDIREKKVALVATRLNIQSRYWINFISRFSSLSKLTYTFAWILRYLRNSLVLLQQTGNKKVSARIKVLLSNSAHFSNPICRQEGPIQPTEYQAALLSLVKITQHVYFKSDIAKIKKGQECSNNLRPLAPFVDPQNILRVGGRLRHSSLQHESKFPCLIPRDSHLATLICDYYHLYSLHGGIATTTHLVQRKFWIIGLRAFIRQRIFRCSICYRFKAVPHQAKMADLPPCRFSQIRPFYRTGVDYAGFFTLKEHNRRNAKTFKAYLCIFVCLSTKVSHIEVASSLTTEGFLNALDRFTSRRGLPESIHSDNGSNFVGAARQLKEVTAFLKEATPDVQRHLSVRGVKWVFQSPAAPNFGGLWEAAVKCTKHHLARHLGTHLLTFEEFTTLTCKIEAVLNSRPLYSISSDPNDDTDYLSPGHFVIGSPLLAVPEIDVTDVPQNRLNRWQLLRQLHQSIWNRWSNEYLQHLTRRNKWTTSPEPLKEDDIVLVLGIKTSPMQWPLGRINKLFPGRDGIPRVAEILTAGTTLTRPLNKLVPLPAL